MKTKILKAGLLACTAALRVCIELELALARRELLFAADAVERCALPLYYFGERIERKLKVRS